MAEKVSTQRVRIGLTGLAFVFLVVALAMALTGDPTGEPEITANLVEQQTGVQASGAAAPAEAAPTEPLADLGVAPGHAESSDAANNLAADAAEEPARPR